MIALDTRALWLRSLERLRAGLPPMYASARLSVGTDRFAALLRRFLQIDSTGNRGLFVVGDYGTGKSHSLTLLLEQSLQAGFATCWLTADRFESALNHPQRFLSSLLGTLETPMGDSGYVALLTRLLETDEGVERTTFETIREFGIGGHFGAGVIAAAYGLRTFIAESDRNERDHLACDNFIRIVNGEILTQAGGSDSYRFIAYKLLKLAAHVTKIAGCNGLVVIIDEVESVFTKLSRSDSRRGAYRVMSALILGLDDPSLRVALAITPDAFAKVREELNSEAGGFQSLSCEPVAMLKRAFNSGTIPVWHCSALSAAEITELIRRIRGLYIEAYPDGGFRLREDLWRSKTAEIVQRRPPVRLAIRDTLDFLDRQRFGFSERP